MKTSEIIDHPLSPEELCERFLALCCDPLMQQVPGKVEIDVWGRLLMSPPNNKHARVQAAVAVRLHSLGGVVRVEPSVLTAAGVFAPDVAWSSLEYAHTRGDETPFHVAPEICVEVVSPSNSTKEMREKVEAYLGAGAREAWVVYPDSRRVEFFTAEGLQQRSAFEVDLRGVFDPVQ